MAGDRAVLRDPGRQTVATGVLVLDADPPVLSRRGAAAARATELAAMTGRPDPVAELRRRGTARPSDLRRLGIEVADLAQHAGWLVDPAVWERWVEQVGPLTTAWAERNPWEPGLPAAALSRQLSLPDEALVGPVVTASGRRLADGRVVAAESAGGTTSLGTAEPGVREVEQGLAVAPFAAPDANQLTRLRLGRRELATAERAGRLVRISADIVLLPSGPAEALHRLGALEQPFTTSQARQAWGTTRRVAIPLLEFLDARGCTERVDDVRRRVLRISPR